MAEPRLRIEEAIEVSYEVEMARVPALERRRQQPRSAMSDDEDAARVSHVIAQLNSAPRDERGQPGAPGGGSPL